jgi:hypothetical protein
MEEKLKLLQEMATTEGDIRDGNIGSFSQGVVVGERNASRLALGIIESIKRGDKEPSIPSPMYMTNLEKGLVEPLDKSKAVSLTLGKIGMTFLEKRLAFLSEFADKSKAVKPKAFPWKPDSPRSMG